LPDGKLLASVSDKDTTVRLWDATTGAWKQTLEHGEPVTSVAFSLDGKLLASVSSDGSSMSRLWLWDAVTGAWRQLALIGGAVLAFSPDSKLLVLDSQDRTVQLWDTTTKACNWKHKGNWKQLQEASVTVVAFSPDSQLLALASWSGTVQLWCATTGARKQALEGHGHSVHAVAFSPDAKLLASASWDHTVRLWDATTGAWKQTLDGHNNAVNAIAFSPNSKLLASASIDKNVRLWDATTGARKQILEVNVLVSSLSFTEDGRYLKTDRGLLSLDSGLVPTYLHREQLIYPIFIEEEWVTRDEQNLLWLPPDYRPRCSAYFNNMIVLGCGFGQVIFLEFE
jgi:WD40 repeat protein